jgi:hypothetical protein
VVCSKGLFLALLYEAYRLCGLKIIEIAWIDPDIYGVFYISRLLMLK